MLRAEHVSDAIKSGVNDKLADGHNLYLVMKNGKGFWVYQFRDGNVIRSKESAPPPGSRLRRHGERGRRSRSRGARDWNCPAFARIRHGATSSRLLTDAYLLNHADEWGERHRAALKALVRMHGRALADAPVNRITTEQVADTLRRIWNGPGNNRGSRLRRLVESILTAKQVEPNPATWARLRELLSKKIAEVKPKAAMAAKDLPAFMATLGDDAESRALKFVILTGVRRKEALGARWREVDLEQRVWIVPAERMKMQRDHAVPLTDAMIACLGPPGAEDAFVFPSRRTGGMLGHDALSMREHGATLHGFRSTLSTWAEEQDDGRAYPRAVIKAVLAHGKGDAVTAAYLRSELFEARRKLMEAWSRFATASKGAQEPLPQA